MNFEAIIEFGSRRIWGILQISEGAEFFISYSASFNNNYIEIIAKYTEHKRLFFTKFLNSKMRVENTTQSGVFLRSLEVFLI